MNILHYTLGLPPYRSGGLTKYATDLMVQQEKLGHKIFLLYPGRMNVISKKVNIRYYKDYQSVKVYELINPLPVPLLDGIKCPYEFIKKCDRKIFEDFLLDNQIKIVHIHTLMGLYVELIEACQQLKIKVVYTTHDYFGLCTKVNFVDNGGCVCSEREISKCLQCNLSAQSLLKVRLLQSPYYRILKESKISANFKDYIRTKKPKGKNVITSSLINPAEYEELLAYYQKILEAIDYFHFNSNLTMNKYLEYIKKEGEVIPITHADIIDSRKIKHYNKKRLNLGYIGTISDYKGFNFLLKQLNKIWNAGFKDVILNVYGDKVNNEMKNIKFHGKFDYSDLSKIFNEIDVLIVPSICYETFGFVVLEALSYGVPVILTSNVGSKDIVFHSKNKIGIIVDTTNDGLSQRIIELHNNREILKMMNFNINNMEFDFDFKNHVSKILELYQKLI